VGAELIKRAMRGHSTGRGRAATPQRSRVQLPAQRLARTSSHWTFEEFMRDTDDEQPREVPQVRPSGHHSCAAPAGMAEQPVDVVPSIASVHRPAEVATMSRTEQPPGRPTCSRQMTSFTALSGSAGPKRASSAATSSRASSSTASSTTDAGEASQAHGAETGGITQMLAEFAVRELTSGEVPGSNKTLAAEVECLNRRLGEAKREVEDSRAMLHVLQEDRWEADRKCKDALALLDTRTSEKVFLEHRVHFLTQTVETLKTELDKAEREVVDLRASAERDEGSHCLICMDATPCYAVVPCGHLSFCESCQVTRPSRCPVCRAPASMLLRVYKP